MGKIEETLGIKLIGEAADRNCNRILIEKTPYNYHIHFRSLKIELNDEEFAQWMMAFRMAKEIVEKENYLDGDI